MTDISQIPDLEAAWAVRLARVLRSQARTDTTGMTRPLRDPDELAFLSARGRVGAFREAPRSPHPGAELTSAGGVRVGL